MDVTDTAEYRLLRLYERLSEVSAAERLLVICDFDGTIAPLVDDPHLARALPASARGLRHLDQLPFTDVAIVSGRGRDELRGIAGFPPSVILVGSHGAELPGFVGPPEGDGPLMDLLALGARVAELDESLWVERKPYGISLHFRRAPQARWESLSRLVVERLQSAPGLTIRPGKAVVEASLVDTTKGHAVRALREITTATAVVFAGDDTTDEDGFAELSSLDVGIKVGAGTTLATERVASPEMLAEVLLELAIARLKALSNSH